MSTEESKFNFTTKAKQSAVKAKESSIKPNESRVTTAAKTKESAINSAASTKPSSAGPIHTASAFMATVVPATATESAVPTVIYDTTKPFTTGRNSIVSGILPPRRRSREPSVTASAVPPLEKASATAAAVHSGQQQSVFDLPPTRASSATPGAIHSGRQASVAEIPPPQVASATPGALYTDVNPSIADIAPVRHSTATPGAIYSGRQASVADMLPSHRITATAGDIVSNRQPSVMDIPPTRVSTAAPAAPPSAPMTNTANGGGAEPQPPPPPVAAAPIFTSPSTAEYLNKVAQQPHHPHQQQHIQYTFDGQKQQPAHQEQRRRPSDVNKNESFRNVGKMMQRVQDKSKEFVSTQQKKLNQMTSGKSTPDMSNNNNNVQPTPVGRYHSGGNNVIPTSKSPSFNSTPPGAPHPPPTTGGGFLGRHHNHHSQQQQNSHHKQSLNPFSKGDTANPSNINAGGQFPPGDGKKAARLSRPPPGGNPLPRPTPQPHYPATEDARYRLMLILAVFLGGWLLGSVIVAIHVSSFESDALVEIYARRLHYKDFPFNGSSIDDVDAGARRQVASGADLFKPKVQESTTTTATTASTTTAASKDNKHMLSLDEDQLFNDERFDMKTRKKHPWSRRHKQTKGSNTGEASTLEHILGPTPLLVRQKRLAVEKPAVPAKPAPSAAAAAPAKPQFDESDWEGLDKKKPPAAAAANKPVDPKANAAAKPPTGTANTAEQQKPDPKFDVGKKKRKSKRHWYGRKRKNRDGAAAVVPGSELESFDDDDDDVQYGNRNDFDVKKRKSKRHWYGRKRKNRDGAVVAVEENAVVEQPAEKKAAAYDAAQEDFDVVKKRKSKRHWYGRKRKNRDGAVAIEETPAEFEETPPVRFDVVKKRKSKRHWYGRKRKNRDGAAETAVVQFDDDDDEASPEVMFAVKKKSKRHWYGKKRKHRDGAVAQETGAVEFDDDDDEASPEVPKFDVKKRKSKRHWYGRKRKNRDGIVGEVADFDDDEDDESSPEVAFAVKRKSKRHWYGKKRKNRDGAAPVAAFDDDEDDKYDANYDVRKKKRRARRRKRKGGDTSPAIQDVNAVIAPATGSQVNSAAAAQLTSRVQTAKVVEQFDEEDEDPMQYVNAADFDQDDDDDRYNVAPEAGKPKAEKLKVIERIKRSTAYLDDQPAPPKRVLPARPPTIPLVKPKPEFDAKPQHAQRPPTIQIEQGKADFDTKITFTVSNPADEQRILEQVGVIAKHPIHENSETSRREKKEHHERRNNYREEGRSEDDVIDEVDRHQEETGGGDARRNEDRPPEQVHISREEATQREEERRISDDRGDGDRIVKQSDGQSEQKQQQEVQREDRHEEVASALIEQLAEQSAPSSSSSSERTEKQERSHVFAREPLERTSSSSSTLHTEQQQNRPPSSLVIERRAQRVCHAQLRGECRSALERVNTAIEDLEQEAGGIASVEFNTSIREVLDQIRRALKYPFALALSLNALLLVFALFFLFSHHLAEGIVQNMLLSTPAALLTPSRLGLRWQLGFGGGGGGGATTGGPPKTNNRKSFGSGGGKPPPASASTNQPPAPNGGFFRNAYKNMQSRTSMTNNNSTPPKTRNPPAAGGGGPNYQQVPQTEQQAMKNDMHKYNRGQPNVADNHDGDTTTDDDEAPINVSTTNDAEIATAAAAQQRPSMHGAMTRNNSRVPLAQMTGEPSSGAQFAAPTLGGY